MSEEGEDANAGYTIGGGGHGHHHAPEFKVSKSLTGISDILLPDILLIEGAMRANISVVWIDIKTTTDLLGEGAAPGTVPTDYEQATGLERLEILGKMEGVDVFDMKPLDASRLGG